MNPTATLPKMGLGSTAETNRLLGGSYFNEQTGSQLKQFTPTPPSTTFDASALSKDVPSISIPTTPVSTTAAGITGATPAVIENQKINEQLAAKDLADKAKLDEQKVTLDKAKQAIVNKQSEKIAAEGDVNTPGTPAWQKEQARQYSLALDRSQRGQINELTVLDSTPNMSTEGKAQAQSAINRRYALEQGDLQLKYHIAASDYNAAEETLNKKFELELEPLKTEYDYQTNLYNQYKDDLTKTEDRQWNKIISDAKTNLETEQQNKSDITKIFTTLQTNNPDALKNDPNLATKIANAKDGMEAMQILSQAGVSLSDPTERAYKQAQTAKLLADIKSTGVAGDPSEILAYAQQYASTGAIPTGLPKGTFGVIAQVAKELPKPEGTLVDVNTGIKSGKLSGAQTEAIVALKDLSQKLDEAQTLFKDLSTGLVSGTFKSVFPSQKQQQYDALRSEIVDLLARARTGAAINASEEALYLGKVPGKFNNSLFVGSTGENKLAGLKSSIEGKLDTQLKTNGLSIYGYSKVKIGDKEYTVGDVVTNGTQQGRVNPDGTITLISQ